MFITLVALLVLRQTTATLRVENTFFRPAVSSPAIQEISPRRDELGGTLEVFVRNLSKAPVKIDDLTLEGRLVEDWAKEGKVKWWDARPATVPPGQTAVVRLNTDSSLMAHGRRITVRIFAGAESVPVVGNLPEAGDDVQQLVISYVTIENAACTLFVRNDSPTRVYQLTGAMIDGAETGKPEFLQALLRPGQVGLIKVPLTKAPARGKEIVVRVAAKQIAAKTPTSASAPSRAAEPDAFVIGALYRPVPLHFPIGSWDIEAWTDDRAMAEMVANRLDTFVWGAAGKESSSPEETHAFDVVAPKYNLKLITFQDYPNINLEFLKRRNGDPQIAGAMIMDEPDNLRAKPGEPAPVSRIASVIQSVRDAAPDTSIYLNLARSRRFGEFARLADIPSYDAYRVGAPKPDRWPHPWGGLLETAADYTFDLKRNSEPAPTWVWAQGVNPWTERVWVNNRLGRAVPTPAETRAQLYFQLSRGAKGVMWFVTTREGKAREVYQALADKNPQFKARPKEETEALVRQIVEQFTDTRAEMWRLSREMHAVKELLVRSEPSRIATIVDEKRPEKLDVSALVGEQAVVVFLTNYNYVPAPTGYVFSPQPDCSIRVNLPGWLKVSDAFFLDHARTEKAEFRQEGNAIVLKSGPVSVGKILILARDPELRALIDKRLKE